MDGTLNYSWSFTHATVEAYRAEFFLYGWDGPENPPPPPATAAGTSLVVSGHHRQGPVHGDPRLSDGGVLGQDPASGTGVVREALGAGDAVDVRGGWLEGLG